MSEQSGGLGRARWATNLEEIDREISRLAVLCGVRLLDPGVMQRVLAGDDYVCASSNPLAFKKLHGMLMVHLAVHEKAAADVGAVQAALIVDEIVERLRKRVGDVLETPKNP
jgi:hypothetical protein